MKIMVDVSIIQETCSKMLEYIDIAQKKEREEKIKEKMSGWFGYCKRRDAEEAIDRDPWFYPKFGFAKSDAKKMLDALSFRKSGVFEVELSAEDCEFLYKWRNILNLTEEKQDSLPRGSARAT